MSEILSPETLAYLLGHVSAGATVPVSMDPEGPEDSVRNIIAAHDAALRAENERLALSLVDAEDRLAAALDDRAFLLELLGITVKTGTKDPLLDARLAEARAFLAGGKP